VPGLEYRDPRHDAIGHPHVRGEQGQLGERGYDLARLIEASPAVVACPDVLAQRLYSKAAGLVQKKVDLVG
jgi:hypothetical protein